MFEIKIDDAKYWRNCVDAINSLIDEGSFNITKEGISLKAMDPSGISMVSFFIPNKAFSKYNVDKSATVGLNLDNLSKILASSRSNERLTMKEADNKVMLRICRGEQQEEIQASHDRGKARFKQGAKHRVRLVCGGTGRLVQRDTQGRDTAFIVYRLEG
jgi:DNA polymerase sliding clamp subunit (PCNA homolog)